MQVRAQAVSGTDVGDPSAGSAVLTVGFGAAVLMWGVGYVTRLPVLQLPSPLVLVLLLACLVAAGVVLARRSECGWRGAAGAGLVTGLLNLLVLGSFLSGDAPNRVVPSAWWWIPGSVIVSAVLAAVGAQVAARLGPPRPRGADWLNGFVWVAVGATLLLLAAGGLVTSAEAGLAVDDWPTSFGYNMFLYPFSRMTGGIYYEHAHRLLGALVGLTSLVMAVRLQLAEPRRWVRALAWATLGLVVVQGVLGGLRVTGRSLSLAMVHGVLGQVILAGLVGLAVVTSPRWRTAGVGVRRASAGSDRVLGVVLVVVIALQLTLGAAQRHFQELLLLHILTGVAIVTPLAVHVGLRAWGLNPGLPRLQRLGLFLVIGIAVQIVLGLAAYVVTGAVAAGTLERSFDLTFSTAHQWFGAVLLAAAVMLLSWNFKLVSKA